MQGAAEPRAVGAASGVNVRGTEPDGALIDRARAGDERAFRLLVERYEPRVAATVIGMLGPGDDADDVGQETFIRLYRSLDRFRGDSSLATYLTRIAINLSLTALRKRKRMRSRFVSEESARPGPERFEDPRKDLERTEMRRRVRAAIDRLSADHRAVVVLRMIEGYSTRETSEILEVPDGTVMSRLARAMKRLEEDMKERSDE
jgi:RNA polymerase sigma-70 factor (ECF subfamily)